MAGSAYGLLPDILKESLKPLSTGSEEYVAKFVNDVVGEHGEMSLMKMKEKPLMVDPCPKVKLKKPRKSTGLSSRQKKELGLNTIPKHKQRFDKFIPLNKLWTSYMKKLLPFDKTSSLNMSTAEQKILKADYHGAFFKVTKSKCSTYIGTAGIVAKETKNMFYLVTQDDEIKGIPKHNSIFEFQVNGYVFEIFGSNFRFRPGERSARKFKPKLFMAF